MPAGANVDDYMHKLMCATSVSDLLDKIEGHVRANAPGPVAHGQIRAHVNLAFLGPDEGNLLKEEVENIKQGAREDLTSFNRRFSKAADYAYPQPRNADTEEELTDKYMSALRESKVKDAVFEHDPPLVTLQGAMQVALGEYARLRRRKRVQRRHTHEPMEVDLLEDEGGVSSLTNAAPTVRDTLAAMASSLRSLQKEMNTIKGNQPSSISSTPQNHNRNQPRKTNGFQRNKGVQCWYCNQLGHFQRDCFKRQRDKAPFKSKPSSN